ncbi:MAG: hypothetical protein MZV63_45370 [Marinilabiliales bacterium]|nr:hypothetical protein [Marinilabiliales bacterium]
MLEKLRIEGTFPELEEVVALRGSLDTIRRIIGFFKNRKDGKYPATDSHGRSCRLLPVCE